MFIKGKQCLCLMVGLIQAETPLEQAVLDSPIFKTAADWGIIRPGHPERSIGNHVAHILGYINRAVQNDRSGWEAYQQHLRLLAMLHDIGKPQVVYSKKGNVVGDSAAVIAEQIARGFIDDATLLKIIGIHDKYFGFYRKLVEKQKFDEERFKGVYQGVNTPLLIRFTYADSCDREKESARWFQEKLVEYRLLKQEDVPVLPL